MAAKPKPKKRFMTLNVAPDVHKRVRLMAAQAGKTMAEVVAARFPETDKRLRA